MKPTFTKRAFAGVYIAAVSLVLVRVLTRQGRGSFHLVLCTT